MGRWSLRTLLPSWPAREIRRKSGGSSLWCQCSWRLSSRCDSCAHFGPSNKRTQWWSSGNTSLNHGTPLPSLPKLSWWKKVSNKDRILKIPPEGSCCRPCSTSPAAQAARSSEQGQKRMMRWQVWCSYITDYLRNHAMKSFGKQPSFLDEQATFYSHMLALSFPPYQPGVI